MDTGYGCFFDTAFLPWAMFCEREDAIAYAKAEVAKHLASGARQCHMHVHFKPSGGPWEKAAAWDSDALPADPSDCAPTLDHAQSPDRGESPDEVSHGE